MLLTITLAAVPAIVPPPVATLAERLAPSPVAVPLEPARMGDATSKIVRLETRDKLSIAASYYPPRSSKGRAPGAIIVHDAGSDRTHVAGLAEYLQKKGFGVLTLDVRGHGDSANGELDWCGMSDDEQKKVWGSFASRDLRAAADHLRRLDEIHSSNLSLIGVGAGCNLAVRHAIDDENTRAVVLVNPSVDAMGFDMATWVGDLEGLPCLIVAPKDRKDAANALQSAGHEANDDLQYIEVQVLKSPADEVLEDKRINNSSASWLRERVMSKDDK